MSSIAISNGKFENFGIFYDFAGHDMTMGHHGISTSTFYLMWTTIVIVYSIATGASEHTFRNNMKFCHLFGFLYVSLSFYTIEKSWDKKQS